MVLDIFAYKNQEQCLDNNSFSTKYLITLDYVCNTFK